MCMQNYLNIMYKGKTQTHTLSKKTALFLASAKNENQLQDFLSSSTFAM